VEAARQHPDGLNNVGDHMVGLRGHMDTDSIGNGSALEMETCMYHGTHQLSDRLRTSYMAMETMDEVCMHCNQQYQHDTTYQIR